MKLLDGKYLAVTGHIWFLGSTP